MKAAHPVRTRVAGDRGTGSVNLIAAALLTPVRRWAMVTVGLRARWSTTSAPDELSRCDRRMLASGANRRAERRRCGGKSLVIAILAIRI
jgi:hypothetical protein